MPAPIVQVIDKVKGLGGGFGSLGASSGGMGIAIGIAIQAISGLSSAFTKFEPVIEWFERKLAGLGAAWSVASDGIIKFSGGYLIYLKVIYI